MEIQKSHHHLMDRNVVLFKRHASICGFVQGERIKQVVKK